MAKAQRRNLPPTAVAPMVKPKHYQQPKPPGRATRTTQFTTCKKPHQI
ncbi:6380_t:CDS:1, partial [Cetraspora pellucida]